MGGARLDPATEGLLRSTGGPPLVGLLRPLIDWYEERHLELMAEDGFEDVRRAHNSVFVNVPADGIRLTDLAAAADMSKQAMGELVDDLVGKGYFERLPDPSDGRAKLIVWAERGEEAHHATLRAFARIEQELVDAVGRERFSELKASLFELLRAEVGDLPPPP